MAAVYMLAPDDTMLVWLGVLIVAVLGTAALIRGICWLHARYVRRQIARIEREGLAALDWHARTSHGGVR